uniref:Uncharacterized protein n=1 Tax=viral metagenome TaxID=1070528 RepID=A0A6M3LRK2_9ZZZZ
MGKYNGWKRISALTKSASATLTKAESGCLIIADTDAITLTLPPAADSAGVHYTIKVTATHSSGVAVDGNASETIDGTVTMTSNAQYGVLEIVCDGSAWHALNQGDNTDAIWTKT